MTDLSSIIERLEKATGPDRTIDATICWSLRLEPWAGTDEAHLAFFMKGSRLDKQTPAYTSSIDAAVALAERVLPGWDWGVESFGEDGSQAKVWKHGWHDDTVVRADHSSPVIAVVLAALRALQSKGAEA